VNAPIDFSLKQKAMPGRISPQPAAPHHGPQRLYTPCLSPAQDGQTRSLYSLTHKASSSCKDRNANKVSFEKKSTDRDKAVCLLWILCFVQAYAKGRSLVQGSNAECVAVFV